MTTYTCDEPGCGRSFPKRNGLVMHQRAKHPIPYTEPVPSEEEMAIDLSDLSPPDGYISPSLRVVSTTIVEPDQPVELVDDEAEVVAIPPGDDEDISILVDESGAGGIPWNPQRAAARAAREAKASETQVETPVHLVSPDVESAPADGSNPLGRPLAPETFDVVAVGTPVTRKHYDQVKFRGKEGFPDVSDVIWLVKMVDLADSILQVAAQPHVLERWNQALSE